MFEVIITGQMLKNAHQKAEEMGQLNNSITEGAGNFAGFLGESIVADILKAEFANTYDYDIIYKNIRIDVKTKRTDVIPKPFELASLSKDTNSKSMIS